MICIPLNSCPALFSSCYPLLSPSVRHINQIHLCPSKKKRSKKRSTGFRIFFPATSRHKSMALPLDAVIKSLANVAEVWATGCSCWRPRLEKLPSDGPYFFFFFFYLTRTPHFCLVSPDCEQIRARCCRGEKRSASVSDERHFEFD